MCPPLHFGLLCAVLYTHPDSKASAVACAQHYSTKHPYAPQLSQVGVNLISAAVKFRCENKPVGPCNRLGPCQMGVGLSSSIFSLFGVFGAIYTIPQSIYGQAIYGTNPRIHSMMRAAHVWYYHAS